MQIEDLSQQAQMAAAEKFKAPEQPPAAGEIPTATVEPLHESEEEEVSDLSTTFLLCDCVVDVMVRAGTRTAVVSQPRQ